MQHPKFNVSPGMNPVLLKCGWLLSAALIAVMAAPVHADEEGKKSSKAKYDTDGDGKISLEEFKYKDKGILKKMDADGDGTVTAGELADSQAAMEARVQEGVTRRMDKMKKLTEEKFAEMDSNDDGSVTADELKAHAFSQMDKDSDGFLSRKELRHSMKRNYRGHEGKSRRSEGKSRGYKDKSKGHKKGKKSRSDKDS